MRPDDGVSRWDQVQRLFFEATQVAPAERDAFLRSQTDVPADILDEVNTLLASDTEITDAPQSALHEDANAPEADRWIGRTLGPFRISSLLGQGGMGRVYRGERFDGALEQTVAIKIIAQLLPSAIAERRFLDERETLAQLAHRHVARLVDGGLTPEGLPFVAMEFVDGTRLDAFCDDGALSIDTVLNLFAQLCDAVRYVHQRLLLHRDIKPANVLVTTTGEIKLLDFGTSKLLGAGMVDSAATQLGLRALTIRYASPEHLRGEVLSTASDVFSLGMTLYRILLGQLPEEWAELDHESYQQALARGLPSVRDRLQQRWHITRVFAGDLEVILRKALALEPSARYPDAEALMRDLQQARDGRPLSATPGSPLQRFVRLLRRNRTSSLLTVAALLLLALSVGALLRERRILDHARLQADHGLSGEIALNHFLLIDYFEQLKQIPGSTAAQKQAVTQGLSYADQLAQVTGRPDLQLDRVQAYTEMGSLLGNPYESNLDDAPNGERTLRKAVVLGRQLTASSPANEEYLQAEAAAELALGRTYFGSGDPRHAAEYLVPAAETSLRIAASGHANSATVAQSAACVDSLVDVYDLEGAVSLHDPVQATLRARQALALDLQGLTLDPACSRCRRGLAMEYWKLGWLNDDPRQSLALVKQALATLSAFSAREQATSRVQRIDMVVEQRLGIYELQLGQTAEGLRVLQKVRARMVHAVAIDPLDARALFDLFALDTSLAEPSLPGQKSFALTIDRERVSTAAALVRLDPGNKQWQLHFAGSQLDLAQSPLVNPGESRRLKKSATSALLSLAADPAPGTDVLSAAAQALVLTHGDAAQAVHFASLAVERNPDPDVNQILTLAESQQMAGDREGAARSAHQVLALLEKQPFRFNRRRDAQRAEQILHAR